jgi:hypothetical protein
VEGEKWKRKPLFLRFSSSFLSSLILIIDEGEKKEKRGSKTGKKIL